MSEELLRHSREVARLLAEKQQLIVFAESCTGGLVAASLAQIPGISENLCGSAVTYQNATKHAWLRIDQQTLHRPGPVSSAVARLMAERVLENTFQANLAVSVTGHLGPDAPAKLDGVVYVGIAVRSAGSTPFRTRVRRYQLSTDTRRTRQREATAVVLGAVCQFLESLRVPPS